MSPSIQINSPALPREKDEFRSFSTSNLFSFVRRKLPSFSTLVIGVLFGLVIARWWNPPVSQTCSNCAYLTRTTQSVAQPWKGGAATSSWMLANRVTAKHKSSVQPPTLEQRLRVFKILSSMPGFHTKDCTRSLQKAYKQQVYERYEPLVGYAREPRRSSIVNAIRRVRTETLAINRQLRSHLFRRKRTNLYDRATKTQVRGRRQRAPFYQRHKEASAKGSFPCRPERIAGPQLPRRP